jgi:hypothetical protein
MLASDVTGNGVEDPLIAVVSSDLPLFFQLEQIENGVGLHFSESHPTWKEKMSFGKQSWYNNKLTI